MTEQKAMEIVQDEFPGLGARTKIRISKLLIKYSKPNNTLLKACTEMFDFIQIENASFLGKKEIEKGSQMDKWQSAIKNAAGKIYL